MATQESIPVPANERSWSLPLEEASALCVRQAPGAGAREVIAVDDEACALATAAVGVDGLEPAAEAADVTAAVPAAAASGSNFEGVASDATGRVFVLQEAHDRILVLDRALERLEGTIELVVQPDEPEFGAEWHADDNARGEGLLLLRNGHVLVAKQKEPVRLIEFGPPDEPAAGFTPASALAPGEAFPLPVAQTVRLHVLASWALDSDPKLKSVNDLAVDEHGRLHMVSSKSRAIARLESDLAPGGGPGAVSVFPLPEDMFATDDDKAEGLVLVPELGWLVALDLERSAPNVFHISGVPFAL
jgi:hypothetical protein